MMRYILPLLALGLAGCGGDPPPLDMATTPEQSRSALITAFDAWKNGETREGLQQKDPPINVIDESFAKGVKLVDYKIEGEPKTVGTGITYVLSLTLQESGKSQNVRKAAYRVITSPMIAISKEDAMP